MNETDSAPVAFPKIKEILSDDGKFYISRLIVMEERVGWYKCVGENKIGTNSSVIQYVASGMFPCFCWSLKGLLQTSYYVDKELKSTG